ncbi:MAG: hypothetical protein J7604_16560 [Sporocytophaga sp.]|uniref:hypothetical protein n=1 Tax=Sporocytophaga sp. TaxID=2231183 RepID=UPI001B2B3ED2|nr:hypothetical protein [Sporocytophaga sp.]MBO9701821.1 hypothetical protein [Sporocytophaga sp.]
MSEVQSIKEIKENQGKDLTVVGTYKPVSLNQKPGTVEYSGHYKIEVNDTLSIVLLPPYNSESKRPTDEIQKFEGKRVKVSGIISDKTYMEPPSIQNAPLTLSLPCFTEIKSIELE